MLGQKTGAWSKKEGAWCLVKKNRVLSQKKQGAWCLVKKTGCLVKTQCLVELQVLGLTKVKAQRTSQGERLTTSRSEITDEPTYALVRFCCLVVDEVEFVIVDVILIKCCVELTFDFCA